MNETLMTRFLGLLVVGLTACGGVSNKVAYELTVDWLMSGEVHSDPKLKAVRILNPNGQVYESDGAVTLPAAVPQSLILMSEFSAEQINKKIDFIRADLHFEGRTLQVPAQLVADEHIGLKRRLTFQVTGLNAAFQRDKTLFGTLSIVIFADSQRIGILKAAVRTPPSNVTFQSIPNFDAKEFLTPVIAGRQMTLVRVLKYSNAEPLPVQIQVPSRPTKAKLTQWMNSISYRQDTCSVAIINNPEVETLSTDVVFLPLDNKFIPEAERLLNAQEITGDVSVVLAPGSETQFGVYAIGPEVDAWANRRAGETDLKTATVVGSCTQRCRDQVCEPRPNRDRFATSEMINRGCECVSYTQTRHNIEITIGTDRHPAILELPTPATSTPLRFADLDPHRDGEVRVMPTLRETTEVSELR